MLQYATIQEAWGDAAPPKRKRTKSHGKPPKDAPERPFLPHDTETEFRAASSLDDYQAWAEYSKEETQRSDEPLPGTVGPARRYPAKVEISDLEKDAAEVAPEKAYRTGYVGPHPDQRPIRLDNADHAVGGPRPDSDHAGYDVALYVMSGILLILLLEQFVQMGVAMNNRAS
jgi:hypothetical protein